MLLDNIGTIGYTDLMENIKQVFKEGGAMTKNIGKYILVGLIVLILLVFMLKIYIVVDPGEKAVIFNKATGNLRVTPNEGFYFLIPLIEEPTLYDVKAKTYTMSIATLEGEIKGDDSLAGADLGRPERASRYFGALPSRSGKPGQAAPPHRH